MGDITDAYLEWSYTVAAKRGAALIGQVPVESGMYSVRVVDTFSELQVFSPLSLLSHF
jgi:hypothetical protein